MAVANCLKLLERVHLHNHIGLMQNASLQTRSSVSDKPAKALQRCKGTEAQGAKEDQLRSSGTKDILEEYVYTL